MKLVYVKDIIAYDGPLVMLYESGEKKFLVIWTDIITKGSVPELLEEGGDETDGMNVWLLIEVSEEDLAQYYAKKLSLLDLEKKTPLMRVVYGNYVDETHSEEATFEELPEEWRSPDTSFYDESLDPAVERAA